MDEAGTIIEDLNHRMDSTLLSLKHNFGALRTGRASVSLLDTVRVEVYGDTVPVNQVGTVGVPEPRSITVQVWDKGAVASVVKAIAAAGLGLNPVADGNLVRIPIPDLSEERRKEMVKKAAEYTEHSKIALRNVRRDGIEAIKKLEKEKLISEDQQHHFCDEIQKITDEFVKKSDQLLKNKSEEIMHV